MMSKIIHGLVDMNVHDYLQLSKETRTQNSHAYKFQTPFSSIRMCSNSPFSQETLGSQWNQLQAELVLSPSLAVFKKKVTTLIN